MNINTHTHIILQSSQLIIHSKPYPHLAALSHPPNLKYLELNAPNTHALRYGQPPANPWLDRATMQDIFQSLFKQTVGQLTNLGIKLGDWEEFLKTPRRDTVSRSEAVYAAYNRQEASAGPGTAAAAAGPCATTSKYMDVDVLFSRIRDKAFAGVVEDDLVNDP
ncbi:uncharacterized protein BJX67DRAFT_383959 [Aspergillus lucknowensis]|uniref:Uncharacterized protein n=1 Tax=Aspergillus lucknowensis TaxID=176173 RepID=A0ABR4LJK1_9EURO